jgi:hypothetical protein
MALSNWDTLAIDRNGESIEGRLTTPKGVSIEIYKNWAHVLDPKAWSEDNSYVEPVIMVIEDGHLTYKDLEIFAKRGPQNGIYLVAIWRQYGDKPDYKMTWGGMVAIGCYGFSDEGEWNGVEKESVDFLKNMIEECHNEYILDKDAFVDIDFENALRYCQGDAYFAKQGVVAGNIGTKVGEVEDPLLIKAIKESDEP